MPRIHMESLSQEPRDTRNRYTLYWRDGRRTIVIGDTIEDAFSKAGYGGGAVGALDWYDEGVSETHRWDKAQKTWVRFEPIRIHADDFAKMGRTEKCDLLTKLFPIHHEIIVELKDKSEFILRRNQGNFATIGWVEFNEVVAGEYNIGGYDETSDEDHHFMMCQGEYFHPTDIDGAIDAFVDRFINNPFKSSLTGISLEEVKAQQQQL